MTEQETREEIINILNATEISVELSKEDIHAFANALVGAGIGDVREYKKESAFYRCEIAFLYEKINELEKTVRKLQKSR